MQTELTFMNANDSNHITRPDNQHPIALQYQPSPQLDDHQQQLIQQLVLSTPTAWQQAVDHPHIKASQPSQTSPSIAALVDGRGLACPMPLLKTKVALRSITAGDSLYVIATDVNSQADITAFCRQSGLALLTTTSQPSSSTDTYCHFIITKTDSQSQ